MNLHSVSVLFFLLLQISGAFSADPEIVENCETLPKSIYGSPNFYSKSEHFGLLARKHGERFAVFDGHCFVLSHDEYNRKEVNLVINLNNASTKQGFIAVQIVRIQTQEQSNRDPIFERRESGWTRSGVSISSFERSSIDGVDLEKFLTFHKERRSEKEIDDVFKSADNVPWHANASTSISTSEKPDQWASKNIVELLENKYSLLTNRIFILNEKINAVSFNVGLSGTERLFVRVFSSTDEISERLIEIRFKRR